MAKAPVASQLDRIYAAPLESFTAERDALAAELRKQGDHQQAQEVKRLRKPSVPAWAVNQASRRNATRTTQLIEAGEALRRAQESLSGPGGREQLRAAQRREREVVHELAEEAARALRDAGRPVSAAVRGQIEETLHAAAIDPQLGELVGSGRLERPGVAVGFPGVGPIPQRGGRDKGKREGLAKRLDREQARLAEAARRRETAEAELREAEAAAKAAAREVKRSSRRAQAEAKRESEIAERVDRLRGELEAAD